MADEVIRFVLETPGEVARPLDDEWVAVLVEPADDSTVGAGNRHGGAGHGQTALDVVEESTAPRIGQVQREEAPPAWRHDEAFSAVAYLTPEEMSRVADVIRRALAPYQDREQRPLARPDGTLPVALITRLFPLLPHTGDGADRD